MRFLDFPHLLCSDPARENKDMITMASSRHQLTIGANMIVSAGGMFIVAYYVGTSFLKKKQHVIIFSKCIYFNSLHISVYY